MCLRPESCQVLSGSAHIQRNGSLFGSHISRKHLIITSLNRCGLFRLNQLPWWNVLAISFAFCLLRNIAISSVYSMMYCRIQRASWHLIILKAHFIIDILLNRTIHEKTQMFPYVLYYAYIN